jgi:hypothetical protein
VYQTTTKHTLCRMFFEWRYSKPSRICAVNDLATLSLNLPYFLKQLPIDPPGTYSRKLYASVPWSTHFVMFEEDKYSHAKEHGRLLKAQVLHDARMVEVL